MEVLNKIKTISTWTINIIKRPNGKIDLVATDWDKTYTIDLEQVNGTVSTLYSPKLSPVIIDYIEAHKELLFNLLEISKLKSKVGSLEHSEKVDSFIEKRIKELQAKIASNYRK